MEHNEILTATATVPAETSCKIQQNNFYIIAIWSHNKKKKNFAQPETVESAVHELYPYSKRPELSQHYIMVTPNNSQVKNDSSTSPIKKNHLL